MKILYSALWLALLLFSCGKDLETTPKPATDLTFNDIAQVWKQAKPDSTRWYFPNSGTHTYIITDETYELLADGTFKISGELGFKISDNGEFKWDEKNQEIHFTGKSDFEIIVHGADIGDPNTQRWKWQIKSLSNDTLNVCIINYNEKTNTYNDASKVLQTYIRQ